MSKKLIIGIIAMVVAGINVCIAIAQMETSGIMGWLSAMVLSAYITYGGIK